jgi:hypothetical protein
MSLSNLSGRTQPNNGIFPPDFDIGLYNALVRGYDEGRNTEDIVKEYKKRVNNG